MLTVFHDIAILQCLRLPRPPVGLGNCLAVRLAVGDLVGIQVCHTTLGHRLTPERVERRQRNGLLFFALQVDGIVVASTWIVTGGQRYIDELGWALALGSDAFWLRDVFVAPAWRGRGVFQAFIAAIARDHVRPCQAVWSDVDWVNAQSMRAHLSAGFEVRSRLRALDFFGRVRFRGAVPSWDLPIREIAPGSRVLVLRGRALRRHQELIA